MDNSFSLTAVLAKTDVLRYTPSGVPVLDVVLHHESWQDENGAKYLVRFDLPAKILGKEAEIWQHKQGSPVRVGGFLAQRSKNTARPLLHIQNIQENKG